MKDYQSHRITRSRSAVFHRRRHRGRVFFLVLVTLAALGGVLWLRFMQATPDQPQPFSNEAMQPTRLIVMPNPVQQPDGVALPTVVATVLPIATGNRQNDPFFQTQRLAYAPDFYAPEIQAFLESHSSSLKDLRFTIGDRSHTFAQTLTNIGVLYSLNPKIFLTILELQSGVISSAKPTDDQMAWAMGYHGDKEQRRGFFSQLKWAGVEMRHAVRDYAVAFNTNNFTAGVNLPDLVFADDAHQAPEQGISLTRYVMARVLARTTTAERLPALLDGFLATYTRLFEDPRPAPTDWPTPALPFMHWPMEIRGRVTSFFDHDTPFLQANSSLVSFWGRREQYLPYDGHTGWDYGLKPPDQVLAAAAGTVIFAGNSDDGCATPAHAVIIDHGNGYRSLYWHLDSIALEIGQKVKQGAVVGVAGWSGCVTGPHLHFQVQYLGRDVDPYGWCGSDADIWQRNPAGQVSVWLWEDAYSPCTPLPEDSILVDNTAPGFSRSGNWSDGGPAIGGGALFDETASSAAAYRPWETRALDTPAVAQWRASLPNAGRYHVMAYYPYSFNGLDDTHTARYRVHHRDGESEVLVNAEDYANGWIDLGTYDFDAGDQGWVRTSNLTIDEGRGIWADAVVWIPVP